MATNAEYEKTSYSTFERIVYLVLIPILFSALLTSVLLTIFGVNVKDALLRVGHNIPVVNQLLPEPSTSGSLTDGSNPLIDHEQLIAEIQFLEDRLAAEMEKNEQNEAYMLQLEQEIERLENELAVKLQSEEEYLASIQHLAQIYASMTPSRAAEIMQNLTLHERVLVLKEMAPADQIRILEKMDAALAAQASILLKDQLINEDVQIAALQERLALQMQEESEEMQLSHEEIALTLASMTADNASAVLVEMMKTNEAKVVNILRAMDVGARSRILNAIADFSESEAAKLTAKLG